MKGAARLQVVQSHVADRDDAGTITLSGKLPLVATSIDLDASTNARGVGGLTLSGANVFRGVLISGIAATGTRTGSR